MYSVNSVFLVGRLAEDPVFDDGPEIGELKIIIAHVTQSAGENLSLVVVPVTVCGHVARECKQRLQKNAIVSIEGYLYVEQVTDRNRKRAEVRAGARRVVAFSTTSDIAIDQPLDGFN